MAMNDVFDKHFLESYDIIESYDLLASLLFSKERDKYTSDIKLILENLKKLILKESSKYNSICLEDIIFYTNELRKIPETWHDLVDFRICYRLACVYDRLRNYTINLHDLFPKIDLDYELGIRDVINSKIEIDTYKLVNNKLNNLYLNDVKSNDFKNRLLNLNNQYIVLKLCMRELEEILLLKSNFDIERIDDIDLSVILGNLIDNAIEAATKENEEKYVHIQISQIKEMLVIKILNSFSKDEISYESTKNNSELHGIGLKSVKHIVDSYNGNFTIELKDGCVIPLVTV